MSDSRRGNLPDDRLLEIDQVCDVFEAAWTNGETPSVTAAIDSVGDDVRSALLEELIPIDLAYRRRLGEDVSADDYKSRFPDLNTEWLTECFVLPASNDGLPTNSTIDFEAEQFPGDNVEPRRFDFSSFSPEVATLLEELTSNEVVDVRSIERNHDQLTSGLR
jgi:hypothetical protein